MGKLIGLDYGSRQVGVSLSDEDAKYAFFEETIIYDRTPDLIDKIKIVINNEAVGKIVIGLPLGLNGERTRQTEVVEKFAVLLRQSVSQPVVFQDERLTSKMSYSLFRGGGQKKAKKENINAQSARIILQDYLDRQSLKLNQ